MILYIVRHGQSTWNLEKRLQGQTMGVPLTALGQEQAAQARDELVDVPLTAIWSSDQVRAVQTAEIVSAAHALPVRLEPLLREQSFGELEGRFTCDLKEEPVPEGQHISEIPWGRGESVADVYRRMERLIGVLRAEFGARDHIALISHGDAIRVLAAVLEERGHRNVEYFTVANGSVRMRRLG